MAAAITSGASGAQGSTPTGGPARFADLGSGGGVPALVLLELWPDAEAVLIESGARRAVFLHKSIEDLGLQGRALVREERAEDSGRRGELRGSFPLVTARSFARPAVTAECAAPLLVPGGILAVSEPPEETDRWPEEGLAELGMRAAQRREQDGFHFQLLEQVSACSDRYPRRSGVPARRPLF